MHAARPDPLAPLVDAIVEAHEQGGGFRAGGLVALLAHAVGDEPGVLRELDAAG